MPEQATLTYFRREIQTAAAWVREVVTRHPATDAERHELDTLEFALIRHFRDVAGYKRDKFGKSRHVFDGFTLGLIWRRFRKGLTTIGYVGVRPGQAFGRVRGDGAWVKEAGAG